MKKEDTKATNKHVSTSTSLDDEQRVKVLSPGAMVARRFFRNRLAMVGLIIIICMFLFSFLGGMLSPYREDQVFRKTDSVLKDYVGTTKNNSYRLIPMEGKTLPSSISAGLERAVSAGEESFEANDTTYYLTEEGEEFYSILGGSQIATALALRGDYRFNENEGTTLSDQAKEAISEAIDNEEPTAEADGVEYQISQKGRQYQISVVEELGMATKRVFSAASENNELSYDFQFAVEKAIDAGESEVAVSYTQLDFSGSFSDVAFYGRIFKYFKQQSFLCDTSLCHFVFSGSLLSYGVISFLACRTEDGNSNV